MAKFILSFLNSASFNAKSFPSKSFKILDKELNSATFSVLLVVGQVNVFKPIPVELKLASNAVSAVSYTHLDVYKRQGLDIALSAGLGFSYKRKWEIFGRFDFGLTNNLPDLVGKEPQDPTSNNTKRQHVLSAGISYIFD